MADVIVTRRLQPEAIALLDAAKLSYWHNEADEPLPPAQLQERVATAVGLVCLLTDTVNAALLAAAPQLRAVANVAVGYDNIDVAAASERGIVVTNTPDVLTETTADLAFALLLAIARRIPEADAFMRAGRYQQFELFPALMGGDVYGKTLGVVGMGRIGTAVARRGHLGFNMPILYSGRGRNQTAERELDARFVPFDVLLQASDFISINTALTPETRHLFTLDAFRQMKPTAYLINTARGSVINEADLATALQQGLIRGAALDVFEQEPAMHPALTAMRDRLVVAPHVGSATVETRQRMAMMAVTNVVAALQGRCPPNALNPEAYSPR